MSHHLIVGLGNPGEAYLANRHNAGFMALDRLGIRWGCALTKQRRLQAYVGAVKRGAKLWVLVKPLTYMNASGESVAAVARYYKIGPSECLAVCDDLDLPLGALRLRPGGGCGGHRGLTSIQSCLGADRFPRLRLGIGRKERGREETVKYVLSDFAVDERPLLGRVLERAVDQIEAWERFGLERAMTLYNGALSVDDGDSSRTD